MLPAGRFVAAQGCESVLALVLANGRGQALEGLTAWQTKAAVPFGGQYRIVDFVLSNCVNSGVRRIALLTQYKSQSLIRHVHGGWGFLHRELGEFVEVWPAQQQIGERWYRGSVDAVYQNWDLVEQAGASHVLVLAGDQIYALDYGPLLDLQVTRGADVTVACAHVPEGSEHDDVLIDDDGRIGRIEHRPRTTTAPRRPRLAAMGAYLFSMEYLAAHAGGSGRAATADFARDFVPDAVRRARVYGYVCDTPELPSYWRTLSSVDSYWHAHMELISDNFAPTLHAQGRWPIFTRQEPLAPPRVLRNAYVDSAIVSPGSIVAGAVTRSVISNRCHVGANAVVNDSILLPGAVVGDACVLDRVIVDCDAQIAPRTILGERLRSNSNVYASPGGVVLATARSPAAASHAAARAIA